MISVIICGYDSSRYTWLIDNIKATIGVECEILLQDNRLGGKGICEVYNKQAEKAKYEYLCFAHEDIEFRTNGWGRMLIDGYTDGTGVIGVAGGMAVTKRAISWGDCGEPFRRINITQLKHGKEVKYYENPLNEDFSNVITLDGVLLFTSKKVWDTVKFDSTTFDGFHLYDTDFSFAVAQKYKNYVCQRIDIVHYSYGSFDKRWLDYCIKFTEKWDKLLPQYPAGATDNIKRSIEAQAMYVLIRRYLLRINADRKQQRQAIREFHKLFPRDIRCLSLCIKYIIRPLRHYR